MFENELIYIDIENERILLFHLDTSDMIPRVQQYYDKSELKTSPAY